MKRTIALGVVLVFVSSAAFAVDYTFSGTKFNEIVLSGTTYGAKWDNTANWTPLLGLPGTTGDCFLLPSSYTTANRINLPRPAVGATWNFGQITVNGGTLVVSRSAGTNRWGTLRFAADNGCTGSLVVSGANSGATQYNNGNVGAGAVFDMDGDINVNPAAATGIFNGSTILMRGTGKSYFVKTYSRNYNATDNVVVMEGASINFNTTNTSYNNIRTLDIRGTATGEASVCLDPKQRVFLGASADVSGMNIYVDGTNRQDGAGKLVAPYYYVTGPFLSGRWQDVHFAQLTYLNAADNMIILGKMTGALRARTLTIGNYASGGSTRGVQYTLDTDNIGGTYNITTDCDLILGPTTNTYLYRGILKANSATVDVGRDLTFNEGGAMGSYLTATTATIRVGRHFLVDCGTKTINDGWDAGNSTFIFDGNGGQYAAECITSRQVPFYNVEINNPGGTVTLADNLLLKGDFHLAAGTLNPATYYINFQGGIDCETLAQEIDVDTGAALKKVRIVAGSSTFVKLMSDLTVSDNLDIDTGCKLFLNGFTLTAEGQTITETTPWDQGEIVGAAIPEPATLLLLGTGALGVLGYVRRRRMI